jgi:protease-4
MRWEDLNGTLSEKFLWKPEAAVARGLVDRIDDFGGVIDRLIELGAAEKDENTFAQVEFGEYLESLRPNPLEEMRMVRKLPLSMSKEQLSMVPSMMDRMWEEIKSPGEFVKLEKKTDTYKAIVLRVNSPGGSVSGSEAILFELIRAREAGLPVVVSMGPVAASGGYWIATASDKIIAGPKQSLVRLEYLVFFQI